MSKPLNIAVFVSGTGRTLQNLLDYSRTYDTFKICFVLADRKCPALEIAKQNNLRWMLTQEAHLKGCEIAYETAGAEFICLGGFRRLLHIPDDLEPVWFNRVLNAHPSLIPSFCGKGYQSERVHREVLCSKVQFTGSTIHFCDSRYDHGPIIYQRIVEINPKWTSQELARHVFMEECLAYPHVLEAIKIFENEYAPDMMIDADKVSEIARIPRAWMNLRLRNRQKKMREQNE